MQCLKPGGMAYVATKTMYFGLDGGSLPFRCTLSVRANDVLLLPSSVSTTGVDAGSLYSGMGPQQCARWRLSRTALPVKC